MDMPKTMYFVRARKDISPASAPKKRPLRGEGFAVEYRGHGDDLRLRLIYTGEPIGGLFREKRCLKDARKAVESHHVSHMGERSECEIHDNVDSLIDSLTAIHGPAHWKRHKGDQWIDTRVNPMYEGGARLVLAVSKTV